MKKLGKLIGGVCLGALAAGLIPFRFEQDKETGAQSMRSLLWEWKKTPADGKFTYTFVMPPSAAAPAPETAEESKDG